MQWTMWRRLSQNWSFNQGEETRVGQVFIELRKIVPPDWHVDIEYRRQRPNGSPKRIPRIGVPGGSLARPDILIHRRGETTADGNLLIAEFKNYEKDFLDWRTKDGRKVIALQDKFSSSDRRPRELWQHRHESPAKDTLATL